MNETPTGGCPICGAERAERYRPFCSKRCADVDLGKWMTGAYAVPAAEEDDPEERALARAADREKEDPDSL